MANIIPNAREIRLRIESLMNTDENDISGIEIIS
jgi:hypothetical protein